MALWDRYMSLVWDEKRRWATWEPGTEIELGMYGTVDDDNIFHAEGSLASLGIEATPYVDPSPDGRDFVAKRGATLQTKISGQLDASFKALTKGKAGFAAKFDSEGAVVMKAASCRDDHLDNLIGVRRAIIAATLSGSFPRDRAVITEVTRAETGVVVISEKRGVDVEVETRASTVAGNAKVEFHIAYNSGATANYTENDGWVPAYKPMWIRPSALEDLRNWLIKSLGGGTHESIMALRADDLGVVRAARDVDDPFGDIFETRAPRRRSARVTRASRAATSELRASPSRSASVNHGNFRRPNLRLPCSDLTPAVGQPPSHGLSPPD